MNKVRRLGVLRGKIKFRKGWGDPLPENILAAFEGRKARIRRAGSPLPRGRRNHKVF